MGICCAQLRGHKNDEPPHLDLDQEPLDSQPMDGYLKKPKGMKGEISIGPESFQNLADKAITRIYRKEPSTINCTSQKNPSF